MEMFDPRELQKLYMPAAASHKGQNGRLLIIGGSHLFHGASLWALKVASRIVDMVFYASISENNALTQRLKSELYDFIAIPREKTADYIAEADAVLIGPGLPREEGKEPDEESTKNLVQRFVTDYKSKKWVIDAGALTEMDPEWLTALAGSIVTPHAREFEKLFGVAATEDAVLQKAKEYKTVILLKGEKDTICSNTSCVEVTGGNPGMTKGGTGDVLAGLVAALFCKNDAFLAALAASYINKKAGERLAQRVGPFFNASDLCEEIPKVMKELLY